MRVAIVLAVAAVCAALASGAPASGGPAGSGVKCDASGEWARERDAVWLWNRLRAAGFHDIGCTGSAFDVAYRSDRVYGYDFYISTTTSRGCVRPPGTRRVVAGARVRRDQRTVTWRAGRRCVWLSVGATSRSLPPVRVLAKITRATTRA